MQDGTTALHKASRYGNKEMVEILLTAKADVNRQTEVSAWITSQFLQGVIEIIRCVQVSFGCYVYITPACHDALLAIYSEMVHQFSPSQSCGISLCCIHCELWIATAILFTKR